MREWSFYYLDRPVDNRKCGPAILPAAILGGSSILGGVMGMASADSQMATNAVEAEKNRQFNREEAEKNRNWQSNEAEINRGWQSEQWQHQFDEQNSAWFNQFNAQNSKWLEQQTFLQNQWKTQQDYSNRQAYQYWLAQQQYNSPQQMVSRLASAGLNPAAAINAQQFGSTGLQAAPASVQVAPQGSPSVPTGGSPSGSLPSGSAASIGQNNIAAVQSSADAFKAIVSGASDLMRSLASSRKDNVEAVKSEKTLQTFIETSLADLRNKQLLNQWQDMQNVFFSKSAPKQLQKLGAEINEITARVLLADAQTDLVTNQSITEGFKQALLGVQKDLTNEQFLQAVIFTSQYKESLILENDLRRARISEANAAAYEHTEAARLHVEQQDFTRMETDLSSLKKVFQTLENGIKANQFDSSVLGLKREQARQMFELIQEAEKLENIQNNWNLWNQVRKVKNLLGFQMSVGVHN